MAGPASIGLGMASVDSGHRGTPPRAPLGRVCRARGSAPRGVSLGWFSVKNLVGDLPTRFGLDEREVVGEVVIQIGVLDQRRDGGASGDLDRLQFRTVSGLALRVSLRNFKESRDRNVQPLPLEPARHARRGQERLLADRKFKLRFPWVR